MFGGLTVTVVTALATAAHAGGLLQTTGAEVCQDDGDLQFQNLEASFDRSTRVLNFNLSGASNSWQKIKGVLSLQAYGQQIWHTEYDPCDTQISALCPVPAVPFMTTGNQTLPEDWASKIPSIAYSIPNVDGLLRIQIVNTETSTSAGCIQAPITNGKTVRSAAVQHASIALAIAALLFESFAPGASTGFSPSFALIISWLQSMAMNGMLSVNYPPVYRAFTSNFAFATGLIAWPQLERFVDSVRAVTGGNSTLASYGLLKNTTLVYPSTQSSQFGVSKRASASLGMLRRQLEFHTSDTDLISVNVASDPVARYSRHVTGIQAYSEQISIPGANVFLTFFIIFALILAMFVGGALLLKVIADFYRRTRTLPKWLESWRLEFFERLSKAVDIIIMGLYGVSLMFSLYQLMNGDSWAAFLLAALSSGLYTLLHVGYGLMISRRARARPRDVQHDDDKWLWDKYDRRHDSFNQSHWWFDVPLIVSSAARGALTAGFDGVGIIQVIGVFAVEATLLVMMVLTKPFQSQGRNAINIIVQLVRLVAMICIAGFIDSFNVGAMTRTIIGFTLVVVQAVVTILLSGLLGVNAVRFWLRRDSKQHDGELADMHGRYERLSTGMIEGSGIASETAYDEVKRSDSPSGSFRSRTSSDAGDHSQDHSKERLISNGGPG